MLFLTSYFLLFISKIHTFLIKDLLSNTQGNFCIKHENASKDCDPGFSCKREGSQQDQAFGICVKGKILR